MNVVPQDIEESYWTKQLMKLAMFVLERYLVELMEILAGDLISFEPDRTLVKDGKIVRNADNHNCVEQDVEAES